MKIIMIAAGAALAALAVTACGGSGSSQPSSGNSPRQIAAILGCTNATTDQQPELFAENEIQCDWHGGPLSILQFGSADSLQRWISAGTAIAGSTGTVVTGTTWAVEAATGNQAAAVQRKLGGTIR